LSQPLPPLIRQVRTIVGDRPLLRSASRLAERDHLPLVAGGQVVNETADAPALSTICGEPKRLTTRVGAGSTGRVQTDPEANLIG
jgi:hypothetical protein